MSAAIVADSHPSATVSLTQLQLWVCWLFTTVPTAATSPSPSLQRGNYRRVTTAVVSINEQQALTSGAGILGAEILHSKLPSRLVVELAQNFKAVK
ncbi:Phosphorylase B Kinase Regulatory Subunit Alpha, Skeletal Muscle Isoform [Manis pentadactyla]|nr:Phosphorylase B Kinase Regulatory Subunit Alpha, Skeletal Muscle Isoform [Manis pentadactyla]